MRCAAADASMEGIMPTNSAARSVVVARKRDALFLLNFGNCYPSGASSPA